ncbi:hypothetical protein [Desulfurivibrio alkaliphilus]|nr:hypothetical protein [Desulfurivibrio alkaliphilus]
MELVKRAIRKKAEVSRLMGIMVGKKAMVADSRKSMVALAVGGVFAVLMLAGCGAKGIETGLGLEDGEYRDYHGVQEAGFWKQQHYAFEGNLTYQGVVGDCEGNKLPEETMEATIATKLFLSDDGRIEGSRMLVRANGMIWAIDTEFGDGEIVVTQDWTSGGEHVHDIHNFEIAFNPKKLSVEAALNEKYDDQEDEIQRCYFRHYQILATGQGESVESFGRYRFENMDLIFNYRTELADIQRRWPSMAKHIHDRIGRIGRATDRQEKISAIEDTLALVRLHLGPESATYLSLLFALHDTLSEEPIAYEDLPRTMELARLLVLEAQKRYGEESVRAKLVKGWYDQYRLKMGLLGEISNTMPGSAADRREDTDRAKKQR